MAPSMPEIIVRACHELMKVVLADLHPFNGGKGLAIVGQMKSKILEGHELLDQLGTSWMILEVHEVLVAVSELEGVMVMNVAQICRCLETIELANRLPDGVVGQLEQNITNVGHAGFVVGSSDGFVVGDRRRHDEQRRLC